MMTRIVTLAEIEESHRATLAPLIRSVLPEHYALLCPDSVEADAIIVRQMSMPSELSTGFAALGDNGRPVGVVCFYPVAEREMRQTTALLRTIPAARRASSMTALRQHSQAIAPIVGEGIYIARLVVDPQLRAHGIGRQLMTAVEHVAVRDHHDRITLHLHRDNAGARRFYESCGFESLPGDEETFPAMQKTL